MSVKMSVNAKYITLDPLRNKEIMFLSHSGSGPKGRRFKSCHLDQKVALKSLISGLFFCILYKWCENRSFLYNYFATILKRAKRSQGTRYCRCARIWSYILHIRRCDLLGLPYCRVVSAKYSPITGAPVTVRILFRLQIYVVFRGNYSHLMGFR